MKKNKTIAKKINKKSGLLAPGHRACAGCGQMIAARTVAETLGPDTIIANATGCLEVTTTPYPESSWGMPWIHSLFENASAVASGIRAALNQKSPVRLPSSRALAEGSSPKSLPPLPAGRQALRKGGTKVVAQGGDGGTFDIGFGLISGMWERDEDIIYICYDTEAYSNTGIQASGATPWGASTTTTPSGEGKTIDAIGSHQRKKDMIAIALAHGVNYVAQTTSGFPMDIIKKVKKAMATPGPSYIQIMTPCVPGWKIDPSQVVKVAKLAVQTGLYPLLEYENGILTSSSKVASPQPNVKEYLKMQGRFSHLFKGDRGEEQIKYIQNIADENIVKYKLRK